MGSEKVVTRLQMTSRDQLRSARAVEGPTLAPIVHPAGDELPEVQALHYRIAAAHGWSSLTWARRQWIDWLSDAALRHW
jgi:hypothetical protein